ncbi:molybdopterin oxidoreductase family protein [Arthrobacter sp. B1805]|uniref:molybdopterin oxidoreductase family protein n=1 Tax=Arthrobacter sp. B1805 TaxID=2058892 RepID=UPI000CE3E583|nr:molybdopterin oxidoreductase family protein [Arthrobacter sp. B1805]
MAETAGTETHCPYCALQCAMTVTAGLAGHTTPAGKGGRDGGVAVTGRDFPTNRGGLCRKGWSAAELLRHPDRLTAPLLRAGDGVLREATWDHVLDHISERVRSIQAQHGRDSVAVFGGGGLTNEKAYTLGKFARLALRTSRIDYNGRFCMSSAAAAGNRAFGVDRGLPFPLEDLDDASVVLLLGSNAADTMPPFVQHLRGAQAAGGLIVVDPRRSATARLTELGRGVHLQPTPGTDLALLLGLAHVVVAEGLEDRRFLDARTSGYDDVARGLARWWPERVQGLTGVPATAIRATARLLARGARNGAEGGPGAYILTGRGIEQHADGTDTTTAAINLALLLGLPGTTHSGYGTLTGQGNGQGGREHGQKSDQLPGYRKITDPAARSHVASVWGVPEDAIPGPGLPAVALLASLGREGGTRCLFVHGANIAVSAPNAATVIDGLRSLDLLVVSDFFLSETAALADVVLPVLQWAEEEGTVTNLEGRVLRRRPAVLPPAGARSELWIMRELARLLDAPSLFSEDPATMFDELARASAGGPADYSGLDYEVLDGGSPAYWPYPSGSTGTPRMFLAAFAHPTGRAVLVPVSPRVDANAARVPAPLLLATGRLLEHYQSGTQTRRVPELLAAQPGARVQLHHATAQDLGISQGEAVVVTSMHGEVHAVADLTADIRQDTVFLAFHYPGSGSANLLTGSSTDPVSGMPEFKTTPVQVSALSAHARRGAAHQPEVFA